MLRADIQTTNHGSIWTFYPLTARGRRWLKDWLRGETVCEHRHGYLIVQGMLQAELVIQDTATGRLARRES